MTPLIMLVILLAGFFAGYKFTYLGGVLDKINSGVTTDPASLWLLLIGEGVFLALVMAWFLHVVLGPRFGRIFWWADRALPGPSTVAQPALNVGPPPEVAVVTRPGRHRGRFFWVTADAFYQLAYSGLLIGAFLGVYHYRVIDHKWMAFAGNPWGYLTMVSAILSLAAMLARHQLQGWDVFIGQWSSRLPGGAWLIVVFGALMMYQIDEYGLIVLGYTALLMVINQIRNPISNKMIAAARNEQHA